MGCLALMLCLLGFSLMMGSPPPPPGVTTQAVQFVGLTCFVSGIVVCCIGSLMNTWSIREKRLGRQETISQVERLAALWKQGALNDVEYETLKREALVWLGDDPIAIPKGPAEAKPPE